MVFFILMILSNIALSILYKISERSGCRPEKIAFSQFVFATLASLVYILATNGLSFDIYLLIVGIIGGLATFGAVYIFLVLIKMGKFGLSIVIVNLSVSIPIIISIAVYKERPGIYTYLAFILIIATFFLMTETGRDKIELRKNRIWILLALASMVLSGIADTGPKVIQELGLSSVSMNYLGYNYFFAFLPILGISISKSSFPGRREWLIGGAMGISILFAMFFLVMTLRTIPGTIVYPLNKTLVDVIIIFIAFIAWKERLNLKQVFGVITAISSVVLLNIG
jgi:drug/metabolite transporter (DMT)-like permease